jgi:hypothetical protein
MLLASFDSEIRKEHDIEMVRISESKDTSGIQRKYR